MMAEYVIVIMIVLIITIMISIIWIPRLAVGLVASVVAEGDKHHSQNMIVL